MKASERKQIPFPLRHLILVEADANHCIEVFVGDCFPSYTPLFENECLVGIFYSWQRRFVHSRTRVTSNWPKEQIFLNRAQIILHWRNKRDTIGQDLLAQNNRLAAESAINPTLDSRLLWQRSSCEKNPFYAHVDEWVKLTNIRLENLKNGTAKTIFDGTTHMAMLGVILAVLACVDRRADSVSYLHEFDDTIGQEADSYLRSNYNYAWNFPVCFKTEIDDYPFLDTLTEVLNVKVAVPEFLYPLLRMGHKGPLYRGYTYIGVKRFKLVARFIFITQWKEFALKVLASLTGDDPALNEFMEKVQLRKTNENFSVASSASLLFPVVQSSAPPCIHALFSTRPLKHYARWQLAELAVEMGWSLNNVLAYYNDNQANRREVTAAFKSYQQKPTTRNRCKLYMHKKICPYTVKTCGDCAGGQTDIEDLRPSQFFKARLLQAGKH